MISGVRAVLFDAVGTLIRPEPAVAVAYWQAGRQFGSALDQVEIATRFRAAFAAQFGPHRDSAAVTNEAAERLRWQRVVSDVFHDVDDASGELFETLWNHFAQSQHWVVFDDVSETWRGLAERGLEIGIASNFDDRLRVICRGLDPLSRCERLFYSSRIGFAKPRREFFRAVERELGLEPHQLLLVGDDRENDFAGAQHAGWHALLLDRNGGDAEPIRQPPTAPSPGTLGEGWGEGLPRESNSPRPGPLPGVPGRGRFPERLSEDTSVETFRETSVASLHELLTLLA